LFKLAAVGSTGLGLVCGAKADSTINFGGFASDNTQISSIPGFGSNISAKTSNWAVSPGSGGTVGTPNIALTWSAQWDTYTGWDGRGEVAQSDFNRGGPISITFTPSGSFGVQIIGFDLDEWAGGGDGSIAWAILGGMSGQLAAGTFVMSNGGGRLTISPNGAIGLAGEELTLSLELNSGSPSYMALDNLTFAQVPEPSALALGALGAVTALGAVAMRRRKARAQ
jgi:hypothetical protein